MIVVIAFSFVVTWLIATGIEKTIGLKLARKTRWTSTVVKAWTRTATTRRIRRRRWCAADQRVRLGGPGRGGKTCSEPRRPEARTHRTAVLQTIESEKLREALLAAGAESIVVSEAHVSASDSASLSFAGNATTSCSRSGCVSRCWSPRNMPRSWTRSTSTRVAGGAVSSSRRVNLTEATEQGS